MIAKNEIGNVIIEQIDYRYSDGRLTVATYGNGIFQTTINSLGDVLSSQEMDQVNLHVYPNPTSDKIFIEFFAKENDVVNCIVYNQLGGVVKHIEKNCIVGNNIFEINTLDIKTGVYFLSLELDDQMVTKQFVKK